VVLVCIAAKSVVLIRNIETLDRAPNRPLNWESVRRPVFCVRERVTENKPDSGVCRLKRYCMGL